MSPRCHRAVSPSINFRFLISWQRRGHQSMWKPPFADSIWSQHNRLHLERLIQRGRRLCITAPAVLDNSAAILVTHVKFGTVNYSCTPFLPFIPFLFPLLLLSCPLQPKRTGLLWNNSKKTPPPPWRIEGSFQQSSHIEFVKVILSGLIGSERVHACHNRPFLSFSLCLR